MIWPQRGDGMAMSTARFRTRLVLSMALFGCSGPEGETVRFVSPDSSSVEIIEVELPPQDQIERWSLSPQPLFSPREPEGDQPELLSRVISARRSADGGVVTLALDPELGLRFYDANGTFRRSVGRIGGGPGEFRSAGALLRYRGDSLAVWDRGQSRISVFDASGNLGRVITFLNPLQWGNDNPVMSLPDGGFLSVPTGISLPQRNLKDGWHWATATVTDEEGGSRRSILELPLYRLEPDIQKYGFLRRIRLTGDGLFVRMDSAFGWCSTDEGTIHIFGFDGGLQSIIRVRSERIPVSRETLARQIAAAKNRGDDPDSLEVLVHEFEEGYAADFFPVLEDVRQDPLGLLWILPYRLESPDSTVYYVLNQETGWEASVTIPAGYSIGELGAASILLRREDPWGFTMIDVFGVSKR